MCDVPQTKGGHSFKKEGSTGSNIPKESEKDWEGRESSGFGNTEVTGDDDKSRFCDKVGMEPRGKYAEERIGCEEVWANFILELWP